MRKFIHHDNLSVYGTTHVVLYMFPNDVGCMCTCLKEGQDVGSYTCFQRNMLHPLNVYVFTRCVASHGVYAQSSEVEITFTYVCKYVTAVYDKTGCLSSTLSFCIHLANLHW